jgi:ABC-type nitrate/sulfonate/bicarbonate transport system permease component
MVRDVHVPVAGRGVPVTVRQKEPDAKAGSGVPVTVRQKEPDAKRLMAALHPKKFSGRQMALVTVINLVVFLAIWELFVRLTDVPSLLVPPPSEVARALPAMYEEGILVPNLLISLENYVIGLAISIALAVPLGFLVGGVKVLDRLIGPYVWTLYTLPRIILMPLILVWFGLGTTSRILLIVVSAVPAIMVFVMEGAKNTDVSLVRAARSFGASRFQVFTRVALPSTAPFVASGIRMGVSRGLVGLFIGELFTAADGIGYLMQLSGRTFQTGQVFLILFIFVAFSIAVVSLSNVLERRVSRWRAA